MYPECIMLLIHVNLSRVLWSRVTVSPDNRNTLVSKSPISGKGMSFPFPSPSSPLIPGSHVCVTSSKKSILRKERIILFEMQARERCIIIVTVFLIVSHYFHKILRLLIPTTVFTENMANKSIVLRRTTHTMTVEFQDT